MITKNETIIQSRLEKMFKSRKEFFAITFESASPTTTTRLVVTERNSVEEYFSLMKEVGLITWYAVSEYFPNGDWSIAFTIESTGHSKHIAKINTLQHCEV